MKPIHIAKLAALTLAILTLAGCGDTAAPGELRTLDLEAAIDNAKTFDLAEIAETIDFIPLDDTQKEGLVGEITVLNESKNRFFVKDNARVSPIKIFDRTGRFLRTEGRYGRGPGEYTNILNFTTDHDTDNLYMAVSSGNSSLVVYDPSGRELTRNDSVMVNRMVIHDGSLLLLRGILINAEEMDLPPGGVMRPFLDRYSLPGLELETTIEAPDRGLSGVIRSMPNNGIRVTPGPSTVLASDGGSVLVKEAISDTLKRYRNDALEPAFVLDPGKYAIPDGALGMNPSVELGNSYAVSGVMGGEGYLFVEAYGYRDKVRTRLVFDLEDPAASFSATGPGGQNGFFLDGIAFHPMYVLGGRLVGFMQALDIVDAAETLSSPDMQALAANLKEDSNPVIVIVTLKK